MKFAEFKERLKAGTLLSVSDMLRQIVPKPGVTLPQAEYRFLCYQLRCAKACFADEKNEFGLSEQERHVATLRYKELFDAIQSHTEHARQAVIVAEHEAHIEDNVRTSYAARAVKSSGEADGKRR